MKRTFTTNKKLFWIAGLHVIVFSAKSCRKDLTAAVGKPVSQEIQWAKNYYENKLLPNQSTLLSPLKLMSSGSATGKSRTDKINIRWDDGYASKTAYYDFVEVPMDMNGRIIPTIITTKNPDAKPVLDQDVINASLTRLIIYKDDAGTTNQRIITYVPDKDYLNRAKGNINKNRIDKLDKDFFGYLEYKDWSGKILWILRIENGKSVRKIELTGAMSQADAVKLSGTRSSGGQGKTMRYEVVNCGEWTLIYQWQQWCYYEGQSQTPYSCDPPEVYNSQLIPNCPLGSGPPTGVDCSNPINFERAECEEKPEITMDSLLAAYPCMVKLILRKLDTVNAYSKLTSPFKSILLPNGQLLSLPALPDLHYKFSAQSWGSPADMYMLGKTEPGPGWDATIRFNSSAMQNASMLMLQTAAVHEAAHAYAHMYLKTISYGLPIDTSKSNTWSMKITHFDAVQSGELTNNNYTDHSLFLENYIDNIWKILKSMNGTKYTDTEYKMAAMYGMDNSGDAPPGGVELAVYNIFKAKINKTFADVKTKYSVTDSQLNTFYNAQIKSAPNNKKLPGNCP